jgi:hypothetical protein
MKAAAQKTGRDIESAAKNVAKRAVEKAKDAATRFRDSD